MPLRLADELAEAALLAELVAQEVDLARQRLLLDGLLEQDLQPRGVDGLGEVVEGAVAHRLDRALHRAVAGDEQHDGRPARLLELLQQREAVHLGQHEVGEDHGRMLGLDEVERLLAGGRRLDLVAPLADEPGQPFALGGLVVDDEDLAGLHLVAPVGTHGIAFPHSVKADPVVRACLEIATAARQGLIDPCRTAHDGPVTASGPAGC